MAVFARRAAALVFVLLAGCGYHLVGTRSAAELQGLWVGPVEDGSDQPLLGARLRASLAKEAVDHAGEGLAARATARGLLTVRIASVTETAVAFAAPDRPRQYLLHAEVEATLARPDGRILWKSMKIRGDREFVSGLTVEATQRAKEIALDRLVDDLSREILRRVALTLDRDPQR
ncbi:MAG: hypothetical protein HY900_10195 [Deltaproteobacteria bacterium]|nr:hypothetical protein [Deltaproteobacteria bacterium]